MTLQEIAFGIQTWSTSRLDWHTLPRLVWFKVKDVDEERAGRTVEAISAGIGPNRPGPPGLCLADTCFVETLAHSPAMDFTPLRADRLARPQTE
ncbi:hypothetical protein CHH27_17910 [Labrenzia sp. VG12]|nr:hypothetical protein CHH27_17910 [Labrenzia sp. VG12]